MPDLTQRDIIEIANELTRTLREEGFCVEIFLRGAVMACWPVRGFVYIHDVWSSTFYRGEVEDLGMRISAASLPPERRADAKALWDELSKAVDEDRLAPWERQQAFAAGLPETHGATWLLIGGARLELGRCVRVRAWLEVERDAVDMGA